MEQMYMIEVFVDTLTVYVEEGEDMSTHKNLIVRIKFGSGTQFIIKENQLAIGDAIKEDEIETDENGRKKWSRTLRTGQSLLFPSSPDTILTVFNKFPLEIELWNDDENEEPIFVGGGIMLWDKSFVHMIRETTNPCMKTNPLALKQKILLYAECCCKVNGEASIIVRMSTLGNLVITEFQQLMKDPDHFVFKTNKTISMFDCKRVEDDDSKFNMSGSLYEATVQETPELIDATQNTINICTELQSCGVGPKTAPYTCKEASENAAPQKKVPIDKIRMGDITGPCGNTNCALAHKVKTYIRNLSSYKVKAGSIAGTTTPGKVTKNVCGACICKDDKYHRADPNTEKPAQIPCSGCGGTADPGQTCIERRNKLFGTGLTPKSSTTNK